MPPHGRSASAFSAVAAVAFLACAGCQVRQASTLPWTLPPAPARPATCVSVAAGESLQAALDAAGEGAALCLEPGAHAGPVALRRAVTLWGPREAVVVAKGEGTTMSVEV